MSMPEPGSNEFENMIDYMRKDLESGMAYTKLVMTVQKRMKAQGRDFDSEYEKYLSALETKR